MHTRSCPKATLEKQVLPESQAIQALLDAGVSLVRKDKSGFMDQEGRQEFQEKMEKEARKVRRVNLENLVLQDSQE